MATKRSAGSEPSVSSGAAPSRAKSSVGRKHRNAAAAERPESAAAPSSSPAVSPNNTDPAFDEIAQLAYSYWEARGYQDGSSEEDWLRAEFELRSVMATSAAN